MLLTLGARMDDGGSQKTALVGTGPAELRYRYWPRSRRRTRAAAAENDMRRTEAHKMLVGALLCFCFGFQQFLRGNRRQIVYEVAARLTEDADFTDSAAAAVRFQSAFGRRNVFVVDGFVSYYEEPALLVSGTEFETTRLGARVEYQFRF